MNTPRLKTMRISCCTLFIVALMLIAGAAIPISAAASTAVTTAARASGTATVASAPASASYASVMEELKSESSPSARSFLTLFDLRIRSVLPEALLEKFPAFFARSQQYLGDPGTLSMPGKLASLKGLLNGFASVATDPSQAKGLAMTNPEVMDLSLFDNTSSNDSTNINYSSATGLNSTAFTAYWKNYTKSLSLFSLMLTNNYVQWSKRVKMMLVGVLMANVLAFMMIFKRMRTTPHQDRFLKFSYLLFAGIVALDSLVTAYATMGMSAFDSLTAAEANIVMRVLDSATMLPLQNIQGAIEVQSLDALAMNASADQFTYLLGCDGTNMSQGFYSLQCRSAAENQKCYLKAPPPPGVYRLRVNLSGFKTYTLSQTPGIGTHGTFYGTIVLKPT